MYAVECCAKSRCALLCSASENVRSWTCMKSSYGKSSMQTGCRSKIPDSNFVSCPCLRTRESDSKKLNYLLSAGSRKLNQQFSSSRPRKSTEPIWSEISSDLSSRASSVIGMICLSRGERTRWKTHTCHGEICSDRVSIRFIQGCNDVCCQGSAYEVLCRSPFRTWIVLMRVSDTAKTGAYTNAFAG